MVYFLVTNSVLVEIAIGISLTASLNHAVEQYPERTETIYRIVGSGFGFGTIFFVPLQVIANEIEDVSHHLESNEAFSNVFIITGSSITALQIIAFAFTCFSICLSGVNQTTVPKIGLRKMLQHAREVLKTPDVHIMGLINFLNVIPTMTIVTTFKVFGKSVGFEDEFLVLVATLNGIFNCVGYIIGRVVCSRASFKITLVAFLLVMATFLGLFPLTEKIKVLSIIFYALCVFGLHFTMAAVSVVIGLASNKIISPMTSFGNNLTLSFTSVPSAIIFSVVAASQKIEKALGVMYWCVAGVCLVGTSKCRLLSAHRAS
uniref:ADP,ATP carrier protein n=1 Tax=Mesocestoides corti TaxID=53468 RepID=A0A5K3FEP4_MESCO